MSPAALMKHSPLDVASCRVGRTGRGGHPGLALSYFTTSDTLLAPQLISVLEDSAQEVPGWLRDIAAQPARPGINAGSIMGNGAGRSPSNRSGNKKALVLESQLVCLGLRAALQQWLACRRTPAWVDTGAGPMSASPPAVTGHKLRVSSILCCHTKVSVCIRHV